MTRLIMLMLLAVTVVQAGEKPNIVLILADDLGVNDLSCYGRKDQQTPHLDKLAAQGVRFTSGYCAQPICSPSRAALMTGKAPARLHLTTYLPGRIDAPSQMLLHPVIKQQLPLEETTIAEVLKKAGYVTGCIGKWHLGGKGFEPKDQGFDVAVYGKPNSTPSATEGGKGEYFITEQAEKFIDENKDKPFFLFIPHDTPHIRLAAKPELIEKYKDSFNPTYAAMLETMDDCVGRIVAKLEAAGLTEKTLVVFMSDNGGLNVQEGALSPATHNTPFRAGKGYLYEGGLRVPMIARWPGRIKPAVVDAPAVHMDWVPTFAELAGAAPEGKLDGVSLAGLLTRDEKPAERPLFWHYPHYTNQGSRPAGAVRDGNWKLIEQYESGAMELYDLAQDISETRDVSAANPDRVAVLRGKLETFRRDTAAQENTANPNFNAALWKSLYSDTDTTTLTVQGTAAEMGKKMEAWRALMNAVIGQGKTAEPIQPPAQQGIIILHARHAKVHGEKLLYELPAHKDTLGYWVNINDWAEWEFEAPYTGVFEVEVLQACGKGSGGSEVEIAVGEQKVIGKIEETGHFQRFVPRVWGTIKIEKIGKHTLTIKPKVKPGHAVGDVRRVTLRAVR